MASEKPLDIPRVPDWLQEFSNSVKLVRDILQMSLFSPKKVYSRDIIQYLTYVQPIILVFSLGWMILLLRLLRTGNFLRTYGFMTAYTFLVLGALIVQDIVYISFFRLDENYVQYNFCYVYIIATKAVPRTSYTISQWFKIGQSFQRFILTFKPLTHRLILTKRLTICFILISVVLSSAIVSVRIYFEFDFKKEWHRDQKSGEIITVCRMKIQKLNKVTYIFITSLIYSGLIPAILMIIFTVGTAIKLCQHRKFRKNNGVPRSERDKTEERLIKITVLATLSYVIITCLICAVEFYIHFTLNFSVGALQTIDVFSLLLQVLLLIDIPITLFMFCWLSVDFRNNFSDLKTKICGISQMVITLISESMKTIGKRVTVLPVLFSVPEFRKLPVSTVTSFPDSRLRRDISDACL